MAAERLESYLETVDRLQLKKQEADRRSRELNQNANGRHPPQRNQRQRRDNGSPAAAGEEKTVRYGQPLAEILENTKIPFPARGAYAVMSASTVRGICRLTTPELARRCSSKRSTAWRWLKTLESFGVIKKGGTKHRPEWRVKVKGHEVLD